MQTAGYYQVLNTMTVIEVLSRVAEGRFDVGAEFTYNGLRYVYDGEDIRTVEKDYFDADIKTYRYLFEDIDLTNLNDEVILEGVEVNKPKFTATCVCVCPVCGGTGHVANGFYSHTGNTWVSSTTAPEQCRSCSGKGYIQI